MTETTSRSSDSEHALFDAVGAVAAHQALEPVDGAHPGPGQRVVEDAFGVDPDIRAVCGARGDQRGQVPQRVTRFVFREISAVGAAATRRAGGDGLSPACRGDRTSLVS